MAGISRAQYTVLGTPLSIPARLRTPRTAAGIPAYRAKASTRRTAR